MVTITIVALIMSIAIPTFLGINRGATAKQASYLVYASLNQAQQKAAITRQRVGFYIVTQNFGTNRWVNNSMVNRSFFLYAGETPDVAKVEQFLTSVQTLPSPMMFDFNATNGCSTNLPFITVVDRNTSVPLFEARGFRFAPAGGLHANDLDDAAASGYQYRIVVTEGLLAMGGTYSLKPNNAISYTNTVNGYTGKVVNR